MTVTHVLAGCPSALAIADALRRRGRDLALSIFSGPAPVELRALGSDGQGPPGDPLARAILSHEPTLLLELHELDTVTSFTIELDGRDGARLADQIAASIDGLLGSTQHPPGLPARNDLAPWPAEWDEIAWERPTRDIHATIRAAALPGRTAWSRHDGVKLAFGAGAPLTGTVPACPAGTVLAHGEAGLVVRTGDGAIVLSELRDLIGPVSQDTVPVGARLGADPGTEPIELRARVRDLEQVVARLAGGADLL